jgi:hypothetical protein
MILAVTVQMDSPAVAMIGVKIAEYEGVLRGNETLDALAILLTLRSRL